KIYFTDIVCCSMAIVSNGRCLCIDDGVNFIKPANIEKIEVHSPSFSCQKMEIIVTMKNGEERKCLNPESKFAKNFIKNSQRQKRYQLQSSPTLNH
uniref:C-X-C motif chemokine n=1 Tax=Paramormyrops kingsleyae TaxID=1676925 RepID=A0A3B3REM2_9TELE